MLEVSLTHFHAMLLEAAEISAMKVLIELGHLKPYISKSEAYKMYGRANVDRWVQEGLVNLIKDEDHGAKIRISRIEIEATAKASNRITYRSVLKRRNTKP